MRIAIIGNSGSGKTTLAARLAAGQQVPVLDLDTVAWEPDQIAVPRAAEVAAADVRAFCSASQGWIIEGCYANLIKAAFPHRPELIFLDPGEQQCLANCRNRPWEPHKYASKAEQDEKLAFLLEWVSDYYSRDGDMSFKEHRALYSSYTGDKQHLTRLPDMNTARS